MKVRRSTAPRPGSARRLWTPARIPVVAALAVVVAASSIAPAAQAQDGTPPGTDPGTTEPALSEAQQRILTETLALAPEDAPASPDDAFVAAIEARADADRIALQRFTASSDAAEARSAAMVAAGVLAEARVTVVAAVGVRNDAKTELAVERKRLSQLTVRAYVTGGDPSGEELRALVEGDSIYPAQGRAVIFEQVLERQQEVVDQARAGLEAARTAVVRAQGVEADAQRASEARDQDARRRHQIEQQAQATQEQTQAELLRAEARLRSGWHGEAVPVGVSIIGMPRLSASDLASWFAASTYVSRVPTPIEDYAQWFIDEGAAEGIRGDIAFAQAVLETGGFANQDSVVANNFSGIGHCDTCASGWTFASPELGVRAQIQLLKAYALRSPEYVNDLVDRRLRGPAGCCGTWGDLTTVWATDPGYGPKVMLLYTSMVDQALGRRAQGQGFDDPPPTAPPAP